MILEDSYNVHGITKMEDELKMKSKELNQLQKESNI